MSAPQGAAADGTGVPSLDFDVTGVRPMEDMAVPTLAFRLRVRRSGGGPSVGQSQHRRADRGGETALRHRGPPGHRPLFGQPEQWATSMRPLTWARITSMSRLSTTARRRSISRCPAPRDAELAVTSYLRAVRATGRCLLSSSSAAPSSTTAPTAGCAPPRSPGDKDATCRMTAGLWHEVLARYGAGTSWLPLSTDAHDALDGPPRPARTGQLGRRRRGSARPRPAPHRDPRGPV